MHIIAAEEVMALNSEMAKLEAVRDQLTEDLAGLTKVDYMI